LLARKGTDWWDSAVPAKIKDAVQKLKEREEKNRYHARRSSTGYSNLIEGHDTRPRDIERALTRQLDKEEGTALGVPASDTPKGKVSLRFLVHAREDLFPRRYPQT
jgi:Fic family protein